MSIGGLTERDIYCAAKFLQSMFFSNEFTEDGETDVFYGCDFCKFGEECRTNLKNERGDIFYLQHMRKAMRAATGVNLGPLITENMFEDKIQPSKDELIAIKGEIAFAVCNEVLKEWETAESE